MYTFEEKEFLKFMIERIKKKSVLKKIFDIIIKDENQKHMKNKHGYYIFFHNLKQETYESLKEIVKNYNSKQYVKKDPDLIIKEQHINESLPRNLQLSQLDKKLLLTKSYTELAFSF
jgi:hypothetical protein